MNKFISWTGLTAIIIILVALLFKYLYIPNQPIILGAGLIIFILLTNPLFLAFNIVRTDVRIRKVLYLAGFIFSLLCILFLLPARQIQTTPMIATAIVAGLLTALYFYKLAMFREDPTILKTRWNFMSMYIAILILIFLNIPIEIQAPDRFFSANITNPLYPNGDGPLIYIDQGHNNFHTIEGRLYATSQLFKKDGYRVLPLEDSITTANLKDCRILMIVNALNKINLRGWILPTPSAFYDDEVNAIEQWVREGGSLFLVADHMPFAGAAEKLAAEFGFKLHNGFAFDTIAQEEKFRRTDSTLYRNAITNGRNDSEYVDSVITFTGHAFEIPASAHPIFTFDENCIEYCPDTAWRFNNTKPIPINGLAQGAYTQYGDGRVVMLGEAMMITAQLGGSLSWKKIGMNSPKAPDNYKLLLNIIHWLDGKIN